MTKNKATKKPVQKKGKETVISASVKEMDTNKTVQYFPNNVTLTSATGHLTNFFYAS